MPPGSAELLASARRLVDSSSTLVRASVELLRMARLTAAGGRWRVQRAGDADASARVRADEARRTPCSGADFPRPGSGVTARSVSRR
jgi:hypothetical protein